VAFDRLGPSARSDLDEEHAMADQHGSDSQESNDDLKAKMRAALDKKNAGEKGVRQDGPVHEKAHGSEVRGGAGPKMHRRKAGGGGS
jgi:hypothetical protein